MAGSLSILQRPRSRLFWLALSAWLAQLWVFVLPLLPHAQEAGLAQCAQLQQVFDHPSPSLRHGLSDRQQSPYRSPHSGVGAGHSPSHHSSPMDPHSSTAGTVQGSHPALHAHDGSSDLDLHRPDGQDHSHDCGFCLVLGHLALGGLALGWVLGLQHYGVSVRVRLRQIWLHRWRFRIPLSTAPPLFLTGPNAQPVLHG